MPSSSLRWRLGAGADNRVSRRSAVSRPKLVVRDRFSGTRGPDGGAGCGMCRFCPRLSQRSGRHVADVRQLGLLAVGHAGGRTRRVVAPSVRRVFADGDHHADRGLYGPHRRHLSHRSLCRDRGEHRRFSPFERGPLGPGRHVADEHIRRTGTEPGAVQVLRATALLKLPSNRPRADREIRRSEPSQSQLQPMDFLSDDKLQLHA